jgi:hypothetical protein
MRRALAALLMLLTGSALHAQVVVQASAPEKVSVTVYRDPDRADDQAMDRDWPGGFAMLSETRTVTLPAGKSTVRFPGVAESMASVTAIVTGLPSGVIEKNRDAALLSPGSLVDGSLGNRVTISRTNPATGQVTSEEAVVRTRADGGLVLQTRAGFEALRCSGLPEKLSYDRVPDGLSATPQFTINVDAPTGGTYKVVLSYLAGGFDWQAHYVARLHERGDADEGKLDMLAWLTLANDNGQSFPDAELLAVAGMINIETNPSDLEARPSASPLSLTCFGNPIREMIPPAPLADVASPAFAGEAIVVTGSRVRSKSMSSPVAVVAVEEQLGDLKLYRVPEPITVASKSLKQIAFMQREGVRGSLLHLIRCLPYDDDDDDPRPLSVGFKTKNDKAHGLGLALPGGMISMFAPSSSDDLLLGEGQMRDYPVGQDVELVLYDSSTAFGQCRTLPDPPINAKGLPDGDKLRRKEIVLNNANNRPILTRVILGEGDQWKIVKKPAGRVQQKNGYWTTELSVPAGGRRKLSWIVKELDD